MRFLLLLSFLPCFFFFVVVFFCISSVSMVISYISCLRMHTGIFLFGIWGACKQLILTQSVAVINQNREHCDHAASTAATRVLFCLFSFSPNPGLCSSSVFSPQSFPLFVPPALLNLSVCTSAVDRGCVCICVVFPLSHLCLLSLVHLA